MRTQLKINGEMKDVEIENGEITIIKPKENKVTGWERAKKYEKYNYISFDAKSTPDVEFCTRVDNAVYDAANYFTNGHLSENICRMQTLQRQMFRWQVENDVNFETRMDAKKYAISNDSLNGIRACEIYVDAGFLPCFSSKEKAKECIEVFKDELTWLFTEFKWRMDG